MKINYFKILIILGGASIGFISYFISFDVFFLEFLNLPIDTEFLTFFVIPLVIIGLYLYFSWNCLKEQAKKVLVLITTLLLALVGAFAGFINEIAFHFDADVAFEPFLGHILAYIIPLTLILWVLFIGKKRFKKPAS